MRGSNRNLTVGVGERGGGGEGEIKTRAGIREMRGGPRVRLNPISPPIGSGLINEAH